jgi:hypothetical protein
LKQKLIKNKIYIIRNFHIIKFSFVIFTIISIFFTSFFSHVFDANANISIPDSNPSLTIDNNKIGILFPDLENYQKAEQRLVYELEKKAEAERQRQIRENDIQRVLNFLKRQRSVVANYEIASIIVDLSKANGADYRVVVAIMMVESGGCNASFWHNCFGYLNGVKYSSYPQAFRDLVPKVSRQYAAKFGWNFEALAKAYGIHNVEYHSANMRKWANSI